MKFLFVHSWRGFCLAKWYLKEAIISRFGVDINFQSVDIPSNGIPANDMLIRIVSQWKPDIIGFSCHYWSISTFLEATKWVKYLQPTVTTVMGGPQVRSKDIAQKFLHNYESIDFIIRGAGEEPLCRLLECLFSKKPFEKIPGLSFRMENQIVHNPLSVTHLRPRKLIFHRENLELIGELSLYNEVAYETVKGCYSQCLYCYYNTDHFEILDDNMVQAELALICDMHIQHLRICDTHFGGTKERAKKLLRYLKSINHRTSIKIYPDLLHIDQEYLDLVRESNSQITSIGIQTTNPVALKIIQRRDNSKFREAITLILKEFPNVSADLIVGLPGDNLKGLEQTFRDILDMGFSALNIFRLMVFPGTSLSENIDTYFEGGPVILTSQGQLLSSPNFPVEIQGKISNLIYALEIICRLKNTRQILLSNGVSSSYLLKIAYQLTPKQLFEIHSYISSLKPAILKVRLNDVLNEIGRAIGDYPNIGKELIDDLNRMCLTPAFKITE